MLATMQEDLDAAIQGWWDTLKSLGSKIYGGVKSGCQYVPLNNLAEAQLLGTLTTGYSAIKGLCDYVNGNEASTEGLFGISLNDLKNKGKKLLGYARTGCEKYKQNSDTAKNLHRRQSIWVSRHDMSRIEWRQTDSRPSTPRQHCSFRPRRQKESPKKSLIKIAD